MPPKAFFPDAATEDGHTHLAHKLHPKDEERQHLAKGNDTFALEDWDLVPHELGDYTGYMLHCHLGNEEVVFTFLLGDEHVAREQFPHVVGDDDVGVGEQGPNHHQGRYQPGPRPELRDI